MTSITDLLRQRGEDPLQTRIFRMVCLTAGLLCCLVILPINLFQNLPVWVNLGTGIAGLLGLFTFWQSSRGRHHVLAFYVAMIIILDGLWFEIAGSNGSIIYYFFALTPYPMAVFRGRSRWGMTVLLALNVYALLLVEHFAPSLSRPFAQSSDRFIDLVTGVLGAGLAVIWITWIITTAYDGEHAKFQESLELSKRLTKEREVALCESQEANAKLRELEGSFQTICAWTHLIKDGDEWITLEQYLERHMKVRLTHGMSPEGQRLFFKLGSSKGVAAPPRKPEDPK